VKPGNLVKICYPSGGGYAEIQHDSYGIVIRRTEVYGYWWVVGVFGQKENWVFQDHMEVVSEAGQPC